MSTVSRAAQTSDDQKYILGRVVPALEKDLLLMDFGEPADIPVGRGSTARYIKDANISVGSMTNALDDDSGTPITFATRDTFHELAYADSNVEVQIMTYGGFIPMRKIDLDNLTQNLADRIADRLRYLGKEVLDTLCRAQIDGSGTSFGPSMGAGTTTTRKSIGDGINDTALTSADKLTAEDIMLGVNDFRRLNAKGHRRAGGAVAVFIHTGAEIHVITDASNSRVTFAQVNKYVSGATGQQKLLDAEIGKIGGGLIMPTNNITTSTVNGVTAYNNIILCDYGMGVLGMNDVQPRVLFTNPGPQSTDQPLQVFGTAAFRFRAAPKLLDVNRSGILYSAQ